MSRVPCTLLMVSFFAMAALANAVGDNINCAHDEECAAKGAAMLQVRSSDTPSDQQNTKVQAAEVRFEEKSTQSTRSCSEESAKQEPLNEAGFKTISDSCCYEDMKAFVRRMVDDAGLKVCDEGGLSGIAPFYSCPTSPTSYSELKDELNKAKQTGTSKCHWVAPRYDECTEPALECAVSVQKSPPAPRPVASGFFAFKVTNPSEMVRSSKAIDVMKNDIALSLAIDADYVNVVIASGPLDGEEVVSTLALVPPSQAFYTVEGKTGKTKLCKVFAVYSIQESAAGALSLTTPPPTLDELAIVTALKQLDTAQLAVRLTQDLNTVDSAIGTVEFLEDSVCEKTTKKCTHEVFREA